MITPDLCSTLIVGRPILAGAAFQAAHRRKFLRTSHSHRLLDRGATGPLHLSRPEIADLLVRAIQDGHRKFQRYALHAFVVMPNHVHLLVTPAVVASLWLAPLKGFTAYRANERLGIHGQPFWQDESYDHLVRSAAEFDRNRTYIEENPVTAGFATEAEQYPWSSATSRLKGGCGQDWPPHISCP